MDDLSTGGGLALTFEHVSAIPKRNSYDCIEAYIQRQQRFAREYHPPEDVSRADINSQAMNLRSPGLGCPEKSTELAFGTPVLKARVPVSRDVEMHNGTRMASDPPRNGKIVKKSDLPRFHLKRGEVSSNNKKQVHTPVQEGKQAQVETHRNKQKELSSRAAQEDGDDINIEDEHAKRLEDRRQRKRKRKEIMAPSIAKDDQEISHKDKRKNTQTKNTQIGFALMHGFSATNVGKNRLTLESLGRDVGVFQKGKASRKAEVSEKKRKQQGDQRHSFSEVKFLNSKCHNNKKPSRSSSLSSTVSSDGTEASCENPRTLNETAHRKTLIQKKSGQAAIKSSKGTIPSRTPYNPEESVVWDIEKESNLTSRTDPNDRPGSILVNYSHAFVPSAPQPEAVCSVEKEKDMDAPEKLTDRRSAPSSTGSPSLAPSQSASQLVQRAHEAIQPGKGNLDLTDGPSKYFRQDVGTPIASDRRVLDELMSNKLMSDHIAPGCPCIDEVSSLVPEAASPHERASCVGLTDCRILGRRDDSTQNPEVNPTTASFEPPYSRMDIQHQYYLAPGLLDCHDDSGGLNDTQTSYFYSSDSCVWSPQQLGVYAGYEDVLCDTFQGDPSDLWNTFSDPGWEAISPRSGPHVVRFENRGFYQLQGCDAPLESCSLSQIDDYLPVYQSVTHDCLPHSQSLTNADLCPSEEQFNTSQAGSYSETHDEGIFYDNFCQGRELLYSYNLSPENGIQLSNAETEVAGLLKAGHWLPQRL